jgi:hypothetical protein
MRQVFFKKGVYLSGLKEEMLDCIDKVAKLFEREGLSLVLTSARNPGHSKHSHHYKGLAIDLRVWDIEDVDAMCRKIRGVLNEDYEVFDEVDHIHIEYDPEHGA